MRFAHTNIVAANWRKLSDFYINVFGCTAKPPERHLSGEWLDKATGLKKAKLEGIHLLLPGYDENGPTLEIFSYSDTIENKLTPANHRGFSHIAFEVDDMNKTLNDALHYGGSLLGDITKKKIDGAGIIEFVYLRDPEGNIIEIQSWDK